MRPGPERLALGRRLARPRPDRPAPRPPRPLLLSQVAARARHLARRLARLRAGVRVVHGLEGPAPRAAARPARRQGQPQPRAAPHQQKLERRRQHGQWVMVFSTQQKVNFYTKNRGIIKLSLFLVKSSLNEITTICNSLNKNIHFITILK